MRLLVILSALVLTTHALAGPPLPTSDEARKHWSFQPPTRPVPPRFDDPARRAGVRNEIDAFVLHRLAAAGLTPAPEADRPTLLRRVTFDLTGLSPTPEEVAAFVADTSTDAYEKVVDKLLASPHYGERWARHWLDLARYADTNGYEFDEPRPDAWRYRDYVVRSFNADKPYDRFVTEQLAGDEAFPGVPDALVATGFNLLGPDMTDSSDQAQRRANTLNDMTDTAGLVFLGLTVTCARCHDHKFEPIPQADYFRLQAFFAPAAFRRDLPVATRADAVAHAAAVADYRALTSALRAEIAGVEGPHRKRVFEAKLAKLPADAQTAHRTPPEKRSGGQLELVAETERKVIVTDAEVARELSADERTKLDELQRRLKAFNGKKPGPSPVAMGLVDTPGPPPKTYLLERGELANRGAEMLPGFPAVLAPDGKPVAAVAESLPRSTGRRLALAKWVAGPANPLTARVIVNRLWQHHFGRGIVATPNDFGLRGERPTHPELLDWLAAELVSPTAPGGKATPSTAVPWSLKRMHRLMLLSATYRQSSGVRNADFGLRNTNQKPVSSIPHSEDPDNQLLSRMNRLRLEGEAVRDTLLAISGRLNPKAGGPGVVLPEASRATGGSRPVPVTPDEKEYARRSLYLFSRRNLRVPFLEAFDLPDSNLSCPRRERSTTAPQALALLNAAEAITAANAMSDRLKSEAATTAGRIDRAYQLAFGRPPSPAERDGAAAFLKESPLSELCRALINMNEFVYLD
ncbi:MAG: hypothetical protein JWO38_2585 [Gemmataceae bacterium]|nr:hypothetical protein [Gemmataceae bacterium]